MLEEYGPEIKYIKGPDNDAADALIRLQLIDSDATESDITRENLAERYCVEKLDSNAFSLTYQTIDKYQRKDKELTDKIKVANYHTKYFLGGGNTFILICKNDRIIMPEIIQKYVVSWYHTHLLHPGMNFTEATIIQH